MIYGIEASAEKTYAVAAAPTFGIGVNFNSTRLSLASLTCTDNAYFSFSGWFNSDWNANGVWGTFPFQIDPTAGSNTNLQGSVDNAVTLNVSDGSNNTGAIISAPPIVASSWQHIIGSVQTSPTRIVKIYIDDVDAAASLSVFGPTFAAINCNGHAVSIGADLYDDFYSGDMADVSLWPGVSFLTAGDISEATRRLFIDAGGRPVDPATAIASLGAPAIMLTGGALTFASNSLGTSGALTVAEGSLTNASTNP